MTLRSYRIMSVAGLLLGLVVLLGFTVALILADRRWNLFPTPPPRPVLEAIFLLGPLMAAAGCTVALSNAYNRFKGRLPSWCLRAAVFLSTFTVYLEASTSALVAHPFRSISFCIAGILLLVIIVLHFADKRPMGIQP